MTAATKSCLAITGGVGGAKLALGLSRRLQPEKLTIVANTGDDFEHLGLDICPDLDTVMYTLANLSDKETGWGQAEETWQFLAALGQLGGDTWFSLGDRDLATHVVRTRERAKGKSLSVVTRELCQALNIKHSLVPMSDDPVATLIHCQSGEVLAFQHYFVRDQCQPAINGYSFSGIGSASRCAEFTRALQDPELGSIILCPSNPFVSVAPVLDLDDTADRMAQQAAPVIAVSPIVAGVALKGPAAKMMAELKMPSTALGVAEYYVDRYPGLLDAIVLDIADAKQATAVEALGLQALVVKTVMTSLQDREQLADDVLTFAARHSQV
jgi:LPPG:FO 2-phospho-L-lactate transferase